MAFPKLQFLENYSRYFRNFKLETLGREKVLVESWKKALNWEFQTLNWYFFLKYTTMIEYKLIIDFTYLCFRKVLPNFASSPRGFKNPFSKVYLANTNSCDMIFFLMASMNLFSFPFTCLILKLNSHKNSIHSTFLAFKISCSNKYFKIMWFVLSSIFVPRK